MRRKVLKEIKPSPKEEREIHRIAKAVISSIKIKKAKATLGGSSAKGTWLKGNHDIDIYVKFDQKYYAGMDISRILEKKLKKSEVLHGSRDYFQIEREGYTIELIPIMDIKKVEDADNITDISPFHAKWVGKHKKYQDDIRLAKAFAKANGIYGAESYIKGFSGYAMEVLTIHYKGFTRMMKGVAQWKRKTVIDPENWHKGKVQLNKSKMLSPIIIVDPVQATRNMTASVSHEIYALFRKKAKAYLRNPSPAHFVETPFSLEQLIKKRKGRLICLHVQPLEGKRDVVGAKLLKSFDFMKRELEKHDFKVKRAGWHWEDDALLWFMINEEVLSKKVKHYGPPHSFTDRVKNFQKKWKGAKIQREENKSFVMIPRQYQDPEALLLNLHNHQYVKSRITKVHEQNVYK